MRIRIYHNPGCSNSRRALELIRAAGHEPQIVEYLKAPLTVAELRALAARMGVGPRAILRDKEPVFAALGLGEADDGALFAAMAAHPILLNRPIVVTDEAARLCRPGDAVNELLAKEL